MDFKDIINRGRDRVGCTKLDMLDAKLLYETADRIKPQTILEIGSFNGTSTMILGTVAKKYGGEIFCIDPLIRPEFYENMKTYDLLNTVNLIQGASPWIDMTWLSERRKPIDYLFIDGNHFLRWVLMDYHYFEPFVRKGGIITFHDWGKNQRNGVKKAVDIILASDKLKLIATNDTGESKSFGLIVFEKTLKNGIRFVIKEGAKKKLLLRDILKCR